MAGGARGRSPTCRAAGWPPRRCRPSCGSTDPVRVLLVGNHWTEGPGGAETMLLLTAELLRAAGHEVVPFAVAEERTLPTPVRPLLPAAAGSGSRTPFGEAWAGTWSPRAYRALARGVDQGRPGGAHVHHVFERLTVSVLDALQR